VVSLQPGKTGSGNFRITAFPLNLYICFIKPDYMNNATANSKTFLIPAILSFFVPGSGQLMKKQWYRAGTFWALAIAGFILCSFLSMPLILAQALILVLWIWNIYDSYTSQVDWK
jgi:TM2 domain-containing membrane protein YozV